MPLRQQSTDWALGTPQCYPASSADPTPGLSALCPTVQLTPTPLLHSLIRSHSLLLVHPTEACRGWAVTSHTDLTSPRAFGACQHSSHHQALRCFYDCWLPWRDINAVWVDVNVHRQILHDWGLVYPHAKEYYSTVKRNKDLEHAAIRMNLEDNMLHEEKVVGFLLYDSISRKYQEWANP